MILDRHFILYSCIPISAIDSLLYAKPAFPTMFFHSVPCGHDSLDGSPIGLEKNAKPGGNAHQEVLVSNGGHDFYMIRWYLLFLMDSKQYVFGCKRRCWMNSWRLSTELLILTLYLRSKTRWTSGSSCLNAIGGLGFRGSVSLVGILDPLTLKKHKKTDKLHVKYDTKLKTNIMQIPFGKLTEQWKTHHLKMYFLLKIVIFHCYVSLPEGRRFLYWIFRIPPVHGTGIRPTRVRRRTLMWRVPSCNNKRFAKLSMISRYLDTVMYVELKLLTLNMRTCVHSIDSPWLFNTACLLDR